MRGEDSGGGRAAASPKERGGGAGTGQPPWLSLQYIGLGTVADCVAVNVTVSGKSCQHELRGDVVVCPLPPSLPLGKDGAPLQVGSSVGPPQETRVGGASTGWA